MKPTLAFLLLLGLAGCAAPGGKKWYAPATWFSAAPAARVDRAEAKVDLTQEAAVHAAQKAAHETQFALAAAPASRPVEVAAESNATAVSLLDQVAGPLPLAASSASRDFIARLLSEDSGIRARAEKERREESAEFARVSSQLDEAMRESRLARDKLRAAFERENALANQLRAQRALVWIAGGAALLAVAGWVYLKFFLGGLPMAAGRFMRDLRVKHPELADKAEPIFDSYLNRHEQAAIAKYAA